MNAGLRDYLRGSRGALDRFLKVILNSGEPDELAPGPKRRAQTRSPKTNTYLADMFAGAVEVYTALEQLDAIVIYARSCPYRHKRITKGGYLRYHYEGYVQEVVLLRNRLIAYFKTVERIHKRDENHVALGKLRRAITTMINESLVWFVSARDQHVHESRLSDLQLSGLSSYEVLIGAGLDYRGVFNREYRLVKSKKLKLMKAWNKSIRFEVDMYFHLLMTFVTEGERLRFPQGTIRAKQ